MTLQLEFFHFIRATECMKVGMVGKGFTHLTFDQDTAVQVPSFSFVSDFTHCVVRLKQQNIC